jgi:hypothetical protein
MELAASKRKHICQRKRVAKLARQLKRSLAVSEGLA